MPGFWQGLADWLGWEPVPGTPEHREALFRAVKAKNDELAKPPEQRDEARLLQLKKRVLRLCVETLQVRARVRGAALTPNATCDRYRLLLPPL